MFKSTNECHCHACKMYVFDNFLDECCRLHMQHKCIKINAVCLQNMRNH